MKSRQIRNSLLLVLTAFIWGTAFVAQSKGGQALGPFSFNCIRSLVGSVVLLPVIRLLDKINPSNKKPKTVAERRLLWIGGLCCGMALFFGKLGTAAWSVLWHSGRKGRFSDGLLYSAGSDPWFVFKEKMWLEYLAWNGDHDCRTLSFMYDSGVAIISEQ